MLFEILMPKMKKIISFNFVFIIVFIIIVFIIVFIIEKSHAKNEKNISMKFSFM